MKYAAIADWATDKQFTVTFMCAQLGVVRQGYYRWLAGPCERERTDDGCQGSGATPPRSVL